MPKTNPNALSPLAIAQWVEEIQGQIAKLRMAIEEPVSIRYGKDVAFEVRPGNDDDRLLVLREGWGHTCVNYTSEGVIVDVYPEQGFESEGTLSIPSDDLAELTDEEVKQFDKDVEQLLTKGYLSLRERG